MIKSLNLCLLSRREIKLRDKLFFETIFWRKQFFVKPIDAHTSSSKVEEMFFVKKCADKKVSMTIGKNAIFRVLILIWIAWTEKTDVLKGDTEKCINRIFYEYERAFLWSLIASFGIDPPNELRVENCWDNLCCWV